MSKVLEVELSDEHFSRLEQLVKAASTSVNKVAQDLISRTLEANVASSDDSEAFDFEVTLSYAMNKNQELLNRLAH